MYFVLDFHARVGERYIKRAGFIAFVHITSLRLLKDNYFMTLQMIVV